MSKVDAYLNGLVHPELARRYAWPVRPSWPHTYAPKGEADFECEKHEGTSWPHGECPGPGMPWQERRTLLGWNEVYAGEGRMIVYDPDGFDRSDPLLWERHFTREEYRVGALRSTCGPARYAGGGGHPSIPLDARGSHAEVRVLASTLYDSVAFARPPRKPQEPPVLTHHNTRWPAPGSHTPRQGIVRPGASSREIADELAAGAGWADLSHDPRHRGNGYTFDVDFPVAIQTTLRPRGWRAWVGRLRWALADVAGYLHGILQAVMGRNFQAGFDAGVDAYEDGCR